MSVQVKGSGTIGGLDEGLVVSGIVTSSTQVNVGSNIKLGNAGVITATSFVGSGANLTSLPSQLTLSNNADNRVITGGSGTNLNGEANLIFDGNKLGIGGITPQRELHIHSPDSSSTYLSLTNTTSGSGVNDGFSIGLGGDEVARIWNYGSTNMEIATNNAKRLEIDTDGGITQTSTKAFQVAKGSTGDRPTGVVGMVRFNTTTDRLENYNSSG